MKILEFTLKKGLFQKTFRFSEKTNIVYSHENSVGKTTFLKAIFYALGYPIPSTKGINFGKMEFWITVKNGDKQYELYRHDTFFSIDDGKSQLDYSLPTDFYDIHSLLTGCNKRDILDNLLGALYMDQEKGWTLLNRGKVIGNISFNIESLVRGLGGKECTGVLSQLETVKQQIKKYEYMFSVAEYQKTILEDAEDIEYNAFDEAIDRKIECLMVEREPIINEIKQIKNIMRKNKLLVEYIMDMKLAVQTSTGDEIPVTKETLIGFKDNNELLTARREMLASGLEKINRKIALYEKKKEKMIDCLQLRKL